MKISIKKSTANTFGVLPTGAMFTCNDNLYVKLPHVYTISGGREWNALSPGSGELAMLHKDISIQRITSIQAEV